MTKILLQNKKIKTDYELNLRPDLLQDFIGQEQIKYNLSVFIQAAKKRRESLDHILLYGPPGLGKTSLAKIISREIAGGLKTTTGPALSRTADLAGILTDLHENDVLFIDEIHRLNTNLEETLYSAMEDFYLDVIIGEGPSARSIKIDLPRFTLIGATTRIGLLSNPLLNRFGIPLRLNFYTFRELKIILIKAAKLLNTEITDGGADEIAYRSRGTPRIALRLLKRVRDFASVDNNPEISKEVAIIALNKLEVDKAGLDSNDYRYLKFIIDNYRGGPVGLETIAAALSEQRESIEESIEPYLIQIGYLQKTPKGRMLTVNAFKHFGLSCFLNSLV